MPFARNLSPAGGAGLARPTDDHSRLVFLAASLSVLFAMAAFLFFVLRDRSRVNVMVNYQQARAASAAAPATPGVVRALTSAPALTASALTLDAKGAHGNAGFTLRMSDHMETLGPLQIRLLQTDSKRHTYDISGFVSGREFTHHGIRLNEPLWIAVNHSVPSVKLVADGVRDNSISGYWTQAGRSASISQKRRARRHTARSGL